MQEIIGITVLAIICLVSLYNAWTKARGKSLLQIPGTFIIHFFSAFIILYGILALSGAVLWGVAEFGILIREGLLWLIAAVIYPINWIPW